VLGLELKDVEPYAAALPRSGHDAQAAEELRRRRRVHQLSHQAHAQAKGGGPAARPEVAAGHMLGGQCTGRCEAAPPPVVERTVIGKYAKWRK